MNSMQVNFEKKLFSLICMWYIYLDAKEILVPKQWLAVVVGWWQLVIKQWVMVVVAASFDTVGL